ncbi:ProQ/FINO family protein [Pokkaliibacter sp. MBI-7]|uniref:ProQ/FINO family protein n=1 Tax=Pokkaliibacter sp. MBI-7 TaxID=3040600 RepID=UPI00244A8079|nr:ProQ/FINO family protein [Pokkaliibacter sp. MBI-7]MDH2430941.1 ProQ/FINO family protein [Pokkaliibacter sp. MBI-7]MDH2436678.1 ProQ/FINO family protein [Pokkaliibacter sp. MBI-7]
MMTTPPSRPKLSLKRKVAADTVEAPSTPAVAIPSTNEQPPVSTPLASPPAAAPVTPPPASQPKKPKTYAQASLEIVRTHFPDCLPEPAQPLGIGVGEQIRTIVVTEAMGVSLKRVRAALKAYTSRRHYLIAVWKGARRIGLDGQPLEGAAGDISEEARQLAAARLVIHFGYDVTTRRAIAPDQLPGRVATAEATLKHIKGGEDNGEPDEGDQATAPVAVTETE